MSKQNEATALNAMEKAKYFLESKDYREARLWMKTAINLFPELNNAFEMLIVCETLYYGNMNFLSCGIDWYSVLHLHPSATESEVNSQCSKLITYVAFIEILEFPGIADALSLLNRAKSVLCNQCKRIEYDRKRDESGLVDFPCLSKCGGDGSFREEYLDWNPPVFNSDVADYLYSGKRVSTCVACRQCEVDEGGLYLAPKFRKCKDKVFDEMPQRPHYAPLEKYGGNVREGMMVGLDIAFVNLYNEISKLDGVQRFWSRVDGFMEELTQLEEMGYNVGKLREHLENLKRIAERERALKEETEKLESEVKEDEIEMDDLLSHLLKLKAEVEESKVLRDKAVCSIDILRKDSMEIVHEFASVARSSWK